MSCRLSAGLVLGLAALSSTLSAQCEVQALKGANTRSFDFFGKSCCIDGSQLVVGAFAATTGRPGSAHVFELGATGWVQRARLVPADGGAGDEFGNSVGISGDLVVVGSEYHDSAAGNNAGAAYVYEKLAGRWTQVAKLQPADAQQQHDFGEYVAIEGTVVVAGCRFDATLGNNAGAAYVFERVDGQWVQTGKLLGSAGRRNDLSADTLAIGGGRILMSSYRSDASGGHSGSAYLFEKVDGTWTEVAHLVANDGAGELSRGLALDGDRVVLGARLEGTNGVAAGAGYVFEKWNGAWIQTAKLLPRLGLSMDWTGEAVAVRGDRIVLSGHRRDEVGTDSGVAWVFELRDGEWVETKMLQSSAASPLDDFSFSLSMSGLDLVATSPYDGGNVGAAYVFSFDEALCTCGASGASAARFGENLGGANVGQLDALAPPVVGTTMTFRIGAIPGGTTGTLFMAQQELQSRAYGGTLLVPTSSAPIKIPFRLSQGSATVSWPVSLGLCGKGFYAQAVALDSTQPLGRAFTNGLELHVGP